MSNYLRLSHCMQINKNPVILIAFIFIDYFEQINIYQTVLSSRQFDDTFEKKESFAS